MSGMVLVYQKSTRFNKNESSTSSNLSCDGVNFDFPVNLTCLTSQRSMSASRSLWQFQHQPHFQPTQRRSELGSAFETRVVSTLPLSTWHFFQTYCQLHTRFDQLNCIFMYFFIFFYSSSMITFLQERKHLRHSSVFAPCFSMCHCGGLGLETKPGSTWFASSPARLASPSWILTKHPTVREIWKGENPRKFDQERGEILKTKHFALRHWTQKDCKRITLKLFTSIIWYSYKSSTFIQLTIRKFVKHPDARCWHSLSIRRIGAAMWLVINNVNALISVLWIQRFLGYKQTAFFGSFGMTCSSRQGHDMQKGHTLFCTPKYTQIQFWIWMPAGTDSKLSFRREELQKSSRSCFNIWSFDQIHHPSWQPKAAEEAEHETGHDKMEEEAHHEEEWLVHHLGWCGSQVSQLGWYVRLHLISFNYNMYTYVYIEYHLIFDLYNCRSIKLYLYLDDRSL